MCFPHILYIQQNLGHVLERVYNFLMVKYNMTCKDFRKNYYYELNARKLKI